MDCRGACGAVSILHRAPVPVGDGEVPGMAGLGSEVPGGEQPVRGWRGHQVGAVRPQPRLCPCGWSRAGQGGARWGPQLRGILRPAQGPSLCLGPWCCRGCSRDPLGAFPWASCARVLGPSPCQRCARSPRSCVGVAWVPAQSPLWLSTMRWQRVLVGHGGLPGELWPGTEGSVQGRRQGAGCRKGRSRPRVCVLEDLAPGPCPWGCSRPMLPCLCRCSDGHHGHQQGEV